MAVDLKKISKGKKAHAYRICIYGADGVGKTKFAAAAPEPFFIDANRGSLEYDVQRVMPDSWAETKDWILAVERGDVKCKTLVADALGDLEAMSHKEIFPEGVSVAEYEGGWGKGDNLALMHWREYMMLLERVWMKGVNIVLVGHATVRPFADPTGPTYDRFELHLRPRLAGKIREWCDYVLFAREHVAPNRVQDKVRGITTGARYIYTRREPAFDAKSRGTTLFPRQLALSWSEFMGAVAADADRVVQMRGEIDVMLTELADTSLSKKVHEWLKENPDELVQTHNRMCALVEEKRAKAAAPTAAA